MDGKEHQEGALDGLKQEDRETNHADGGLQCDWPRHGGDRTENEQTFDWIKNEDEDSDHEQAPDKVEIDSKETLFVFKESDSEKPLDQVKEENDETDIEAEFSVVQENTGNESEGAFDQVEGDMEGAELVLVLGHWEDDEIMHCERVFDEMKEEQSQEEYPIPEETTDIKESKEIHETQSNAEVQTETIKVGTMRRASSRRMKNEKLIDFVRQGSMKEHLLQVRKQKSAEKKRSTAPGFGPIVEDDLQQNLMAILQDWWPGGVISMEDLDFITKVWVPEVIIGALIAVQGLTYMEAFQFFLEDHLISEEHLKIEDITGSHSKMPSILPCPAYPPLKETTSKKKSTKKLSKTVSKKLACMYCGKLLSHRISMHLENMHSHEPDVAKAFAKKGRERKQAISCLKHKGNFKHNITLLDTGKQDEIVVVKRTSRQMSGYVPCTNCLGFYTKSELWRHMTNTCPLKSQTSNQHDQKSSLAHSEILLQSALGKTGDKLLDKLSMMRDGTRKAIENDTLILKLGDILLKKLGIRRKNYISSQMHQLGLLKLQLQEWDFQLSEYITPAKFDDIVEAVKEMAHCIQSREDLVVFRKPAIALHLGHLLNKLALVKYGHSIREGNWNDEKDAKTFLRLMNNEWADCVSFAALASPRTKKYHRLQILPLTEDLVNLRGYLAKRATTLVNALKRETTYGNWRSLAEITLARLVLFNKRRSSEAAKLLIDSYVNRPDWKAKAIQEMSNTFTAVEKKLLERMDLIQSSQGKKNNKACTLMTPAFKESMDLLIGKREDVGIKPANKFLFANQEMGHLSAWNVLNASAVAAGCKNPAAISSNSFRKYISTVCQVLDLNSSEIDWLAQHLSRNVHTHNDFNKLQEDAIELAKVSKILIATEDSSVSKYAGKSLAEIDLADMGLSEEDENPDELRGGDYNELEDILTESHFVPEDSVTSLDEAINGHSEIDEEPMKKKMLKEKPVRKKLLKETPVKRKLLKEELVSNNGPASKLRKKNPVIYSDCEDSTEENDEDKNFKLPENGVLPKEAPSRKVSEKAPSGKAPSEKAPSESVKHGKVSGHSRRYWSPQEKKFFNKVFEKSLRQREMPPGHLILKAAKLLPHRTVPQIRVRVNNLIRGKQAA